MANGTVKYGIMDGSIATVWALKFVKESISVRKVIALEGIIGILAAGNARQLANCFATHISEEQSSISHLVQAAIEVCCLPVD